MSQGIHIRNIPRIHCKLKYHSIFFAMVFYSALATAQTVRFDDIEFTNKLYNSIIKNMTFYHVSQNFQRKFNDTMYSMQSVFNEDVQMCPIPNKGQIYNVSYTTEFIDDTNFLFIAYYINPTTYTYYNVEDKDFKKNSIFFQSENEPNVFFLGNKLQRSGLIAIHRDSVYINNPIFFISGEMYLDNSKSKIFNNNINLYNIRKYISIRYFNYFPEKITLKSDSHIIFYSKALNRTVNVYVEQGIKADKIEVW